MGSSPIPQAGTTIPTPGQPRPLGVTEWVPSASPTTVSFRSSRVDPPSALYVQVGDQLVIDVETQLASELVIVAARVLLPHGPQPGQPSTPPGGASSSTPETQTAYIQQLIFNVSALVNVGKRMAFLLPEGYLLSVAAVGTNTVSRGTTFCRCWLEQRATTTNYLPASMVLFADYVTGYAPLGWPGGQQRGSSESSGWLVEVALGNPSAGADWTYTIGTQQRVRIISVGARLVTSATAGNRIPRIQILSALGTIAWSAATQQALAASLTGQFAAGAGQFTSIVDTLTLNAPLPDGATMAPGDTIRVSTANLQAGDQWSNIVVVIESWMDVV